MKTDKEIVQWLKDKGVYDKFIHYVENDELNDEDEVQSYISGEMGIMTLEYSFDWVTTEEGSDFWANIDNEFLEWVEYDKIKKQLI